jgi:hypothetical protein
MTRTQILSRAALDATAAVGLLATGIAQARDRGPDVSWSLSFGVPIGAPIAGVTIGNAPSAYGPSYYGPAYYGPSYYEVAPPVHYRPHYRPAPRPIAHGRRDADRDGIPDRWDRRYNPRWDRDGDGVPNRYDRHPRRADRDGRDGRHDRDGRDGRWNGR